MACLILCLFLLIAAGTAAVHLWAHMRTLDAQRHSGDVFVDADRYRPMLRLLSDTDNGFTPDHALRRKLRSQRRELFREYLRHLTQDYGKLLAGLRLIMAQSGVDRPDLAKALARNRLLFALAVCRIEFRLWLYALGIDEAERVKLDALNLLDALNALRGQFSFVESAVWGA